MSSQNNHRLRSSALPSPSRRPPGPPSPPAADAEPPAFGQALSALLLRSSSVAAPLLAIVDLIGWYDPAGRAVHYAGLLATHSLVSWLAYLLRLPPATIQTGWTNVLILLLTYSLSSIPIVRRNRPPDPAWPTQLQELADRLDDFPLIASHPFGPSAARFHRSSAASPAHPAYRFLTILLLCLVPRHPVSTMRLGNHLIYFFLRNILITWYSPWASRLRSWFIKLIAPRSSRSANSSLINDGRDSSVDPLGQRRDSRSGKSIQIAFTLIEHQRWWQDLGVEFESSLSGLVNCPVKIEFMCHPTGRIFGIEGSSHLTGLSYLHRSKSNLEALVNPKLRKMK